MDNKANTVLDQYRPTISAVNYFIDKWNTLDDYVHQEQALDRLFIELCPKNREITDILIKCSALNDFYSTNIFKVHNVALHYLSLDIDKRLEIGDATLVNDLAHITINGKQFYFYSFATKYCSHHQPLKFAIYDNYVDKLLKYYRDKDGFCKFKAADLKNYQIYLEIIRTFQRFYGIDMFTLKQIDKYLWQLGKEAFNRYS